MGGDQRSFRWRGSQHLEEQLEKREVQQKGPQERILGVKSEPSQRLHILAQREPAPPSERAGPSSTPLSCISLKAGCAPKFFGPNRGNALFFVIRFTDALRLRIFFFLEMTQRKEVKT